LVYCKSQSKIFKYSLLHIFGINAEQNITSVQTFLHLSENQLSKKGMILGILVAVTILSCPVYGSLPITENEYSLMHYTKLISEEYFTFGRSLVIVLPLAEDNTTNEDVGYLIEELHTSGRWPILVYNVG
jgi:hypothetical protein